jgi:hypothetical protein
MFVRWQRRDTSPTKNWRTVRLVASLVESVRIEGTPRSQHVAYLGNIVETQISDTRAQCRFWENVVRKLDALQNRITAEECQRIERTLADRVPCPTRAHILDSISSAGARTRRGEDFKYHSGMHTPLARDFLAAD